MNEKPSRLGRGLGDLLDDNTPTIRSQKPSVIVRNGEPQRSAPKTIINNKLYDTTPKPLFETKPKNRSLK